MNLKAHFKLYKRNLAAIFAIAVITVIAVSVFGNKYAENTYETTVFLSIGVQKDILETSDSTSYDDVQAADQFTETVQGWFKNPSFLKKIENQIGSDLDIAAQKQEKQNLLITFSEKSENQSNKISSIIKNGLDTEILRYNAKTDTNFQIALYSTDISEINSKLPLLIFFSLILGLLLGYCTAYVYEYASGYVMDCFRVEEILSKKTDENLSKSGINSKKGEYLNTIIQKRFQKKLYIIGVEFNPDPIKKMFDKKLPRYHFEQLKFPDNAEEMIKLEKENVLLIVKPGKSRISALEKIKVLLPDNYILLIID